MAVHLTKEQREIAFRLRAKGMSLKVIAKAVGYAHPTKSWAIIRATQPSRMRTAETNNTVQSKSEAGKFR